MARNSEPRLDRIARGGKGSQATWKSVTQRQLDGAANNMHRETGFCLSKSWKPLICSLKKLPPGKHFEENLLFL
jgi:hypothetical protein